MARVLRLTAWALMLAAAAAPAAALEEGDVGLTIGLGLAHLTGDLGDDARDNAAFAVAVSYGLLDWLGVEVGGEYGNHTEKDERRAGDLRLSLGQVHAGPRFSFQVSPVEFWLAAGAGATFYVADVDFPNDNGGTERDDESGAAPTLTGAAGVDFELGDIFSLGIGGRLYYGLADIDYLSPHGRRERTPVVVLPSLRASFWF